MTSTTTPDPAPTAPEPAPPEWHRATPEGDKTMAFTPAARWRAQIADGAATDAAHAHAAAIGLLEVIDRFRFREPGDPIPAPGTADLPDTVREHAVEALHAAATCRILLGDLLGRVSDDLTGALFGDPVDADDHGEEDPVEAVDAAIAAASERAQSLGLAAQRALRRLAQVGLGVAQHAHGDDDVELVERAMIAVLLHDETGTPARDDEHPIVGRTPHEVSVELAGLLARMLCDLDAGVDPAPACRVVGPDGTTVRLTVTEAGGVEVDGIGRFPAPVTLVEVTTAVLAVLTDAGAELGRLRIEWTHRA